jgi:hypothetical protein
MYSVVSVVCCSQWTILVVRPADELAGLASWRSLLSAELARFWTWVARLAADRLATELAAFWLWLAGLAGLAPARHVPVILLMSAVLP